ncbi:MAG TPA: sulfotransferase [Rudaea sp.]|jgi:tetratricopeptide (TPR) repeat protein|nr:sulfotransferase [Rudaea sp.]
MSEATAFSEPATGGRDPRLDGLSSSAARRLGIAAQALTLGQVAVAEQRLAGLIDVYPDHPEVLRMFAGLQSLRGNHAGATATMERAVAQRPTDAAYLSSYGSALLETARYDEAIDALKRACEYDPNYTTAWYNLGLAYIRCMHVDEAKAALLRAVSQAPELSINARVILGDMFRAENRLDEAKAEYREAIAIQKNAGMAWWGLSEIKTQRFGDDDLAELGAAMKTPGASEDEMAAMGFTLARALDDRKQYAESLAALEQANARIRARKRWDARVYSEHIDAVLQTFTPPPAGAVDPTLGREAIFVTSMPRSGSTLTEQVLASHSQVDGGGEVSDLPSVLMEEARRLNRSFPDFVHELTPSDWARMGQRYLDRTMKWRGTRPRFTDKMPSNWQYIGAIRAMLPGAHVVVVRRNPLETCLSCYRQRLANSEYTRTFADLGAAWRDFDRAVKYWRNLHPNNVYENVYEEFVADPEGKIRQLLAFCDLPFEQGCLEFHKTERSVHTPSATQVREPLRADTARAHRYGSLLDPLRAALGMPPFSAQ